MRMILVDDDAAFATVLSAGLEALGHDVTAVAPEQGAAALATTDYDVAIVDADPEAGRAFLTACRRESPETMVIVMTSELTVETSIEVLRGGAAALAVDYIAKPSSGLVRRIDAAARRFVEVIERGPFLADTTRRQGYYDGRSLELTDHEFGLFSAFMERPYEDLDYSELGRVALGRAVSYDEAYTALRSPVSRLRKKLRDAAGREVISRHVDGAGMRFVPGGVGRRRDTSKPGGSGARSRRAIPATG